MDLRLPPGTPKRTVMTLCCVTFRRDAMKAVEDERERLNAEHAAVMAAAKGQWEAETQRLVQEAKEATRKLVVRGRLDRAPVYI
jgi:hypothetical protein